MEFGVRNHPHGEQTIHHDISAKSESPWQVQLSFSRLPASQSKDVGTPPRSHPYFLSFPIYELT